MKKLFTLIVIISFSVATPSVPAGQKDLVGDLEACEVLLEECAKEKAQCLEKIKIYEQALTACASSNKNDGDISLADALILIPGFEKISKKKQAGIVAILTTLITVGVLFIPAPE